MSQLGFLGLPLEIRLMTYSFLLVSSSTISVWPATTLSGQGAPAEPIPNSPVFGLALGLLGCNSTIAAEAAAVFYGENIFRIHGLNQDYRLAVNWLKQIGLRNRSYLGTLEMRVWTPLKAWQQPDGMRVRRSEKRIPDGHPLRASRMEYWSPRHPHLPTPSLPCPAGQVDIVDPLIETIVELLARCGGRRLRLHLHLGLLPSNIIPGIEIAENHEAVDQFTMDLPNLIETWRAHYTSDDHLRDVDVLWTAYTDSRFLLGKRTLIDGIGWQIVEERENNWTQDADEARLTPVTLLLRRKKLTTAIGPATPCPSEPSLLFLGPYSRRPRGTG
ncbi:MAG: hypothetical protein Q9182_001420 [Xanthomendoza sp. 2 TL-2023]